MTTTTTGTDEETKPTVRIDPRIRERRIEVIRQAGRRRLRVLLVVSIVLSTVGIAYLVVTSPLLDVDRIQVTGAQHQTKAEVRAASGIRVHDHLLFADTATAVRRIEQLPWVAQASVHRDLPGTVRIVVREYVAAAYARVAGGVMLVAANGHVIGRVRVAPAHTVEIRGVRRAPTAGELLSPPDAAGVVAKLPAALAQRVVAIDVGGESLALDMTGGGEIRLGDASDLGAKAIAALAVLGHRAGAPYVYIDVSIPSRPVVRA